MRYALTLGIMCVLAVSCKPKNAGSSAGSDVMDAGVVTQNCQQDLSAVRLRMQAIDGELSALQQTRSSVVQPIRDGQNGEQSCDQVAQGVLSNCMAQASYQAYRASKSGWYCWANPSNVNCQDPCRSAFGASYDQCMKRNQDIMNMNAQRAGNQALMGEVGNIDRRLQALAQERAGLDIQVRNCEAAMGRTAIQPQQPVNATGQRPSVVCDATRHLKDVGGYCACEPPYQAGQDGVCRNYSACNLQTQFLGMDGKCYPKSGTNIKTSCASDEYLMSNGTCVSVYEWETRNSR